MNTITFTPDQLFHLEHMAVLHICGVDARSFMQSQLTSSVEDLAENQAVLAGFCQAKGRLQATMIVWTDPANEQNLYALVHRSIADDVRKRISMFLLRAKAELTITPTQVYGVFNAPTEAFTLPAAHYTCSHHKDGSSTLISAPSANVSLPARAWLIVYGNTDQTAPLASTELTQQWQAADIQAGLPWIEKLSYETFLPQDINLDIIGGVSFKKGCFPGQEVVARLHYRTTAKRRAAVGVFASEHTIEGLSVGSDIFEAATPDRPFGRIINSAYDAKAKQYSLLMEVPIADIEQKTIYAVSATGPEIHLQDLPFAWEIAKY